MARRCPGVVRLVLDDSNPARMLVLLRMLGDERCVELAQEAITAIG